MKTNALFLFGISNLILFLLAFGLSFIDSRLINGVNVWNKPMKFALTSWIYVWTIAFFLPYLPEGREVKIVEWTVIITMAIELILIFMQAGRGVASHFNIFSGLFNSGVFQIMGFVITINTIMIGYLAWLFFKFQPDLPLAYLWGIRISLILFVIFSLEGFVMGALLKHSVGGNDGGKSIPFLNWNTNIGDLRVAHFIGLHSLQIIPFVAYLLVILQSNYPFLSALTGTYIFSFGYFCFALATFIQALMGKPLIHLN